MDIGSLISTLAGYDEATVTFAAANNSGTPRISAAVTSAGRTVTLTL